VLPRFQRTLLPRYLISTHSDPAIRVACTSERSVMKPTYTRREHPITVSKPSLLFGNVGTAKH
jgi:hypothetical protein